MKVISLYSMKGGVGKTAAAVNLAYLSAADGYRTLLCDLDPQGASSYYFRIKASKNFSSKNFLKGGKNIDKNIRGTDYKNLDLLPSKMSYRNLDLALDSLKSSKKRLKDVLADLDEEYDFIILDCPPGISLISENVFNASDSILVPLIPTTLSVRTYIKLLRFFKKNDLKVAKIHAFFSMVEKRKSLHRETIEKMSVRIKRFLKTEIPYRSDIEKMGLYRKPVPEFEPASLSTQSYRNLWDEIGEVIF